MIDFSLNEEQKMLRSLAHDYAEKEIRPIALKMDQEPDPSKSFAMAFEAAKKGFQLGFGKIKIPEKYGGIGKGNIELAIVIEEITWGDVGIACCISACAGVADMIAFAGTEEQIEKWVIPYCECKTGDFIFCGSMTEPAGGSEMVCPLPDPALGMKDRAVLDGDEYVLNASRLFCTGSAVAKALMISLRTDQTKPNKDSIADFLVPMDTPGVTVGAANDMIGFRGSVQADLFLDNVRLPKSCYFGPVDLDWGAYLTGGVKIGARAIGIARAAYEEALNFATDRIIWGQRLRDHEYISAKLTDMRMKIEATRSLVYRMAWALDNRELSEGLYNLLPIAMINGCDMVRQVTVDAMDIIGTFSSSRECAVQKYARDALVLPLIDGGANLQRVLLSKRL